MHQIYQSIKAFVVREAKTGVSTSSCFASRSRLYCSHRACKCFIRLSRFIFGIHDNIGWCFVNSSIPSTGSNQGIITASYPWFCGAIDSIVGISCFIGGVIFHKGSLVTFSLRSTITSISSLPTELRSCHPIQILIRHIKYFCALERRYFLTPVSPWNGILTLKPLPRFLRVTYKFRKFSWLSCVRNISSIQQNHILSHDKASSAFLRVYPLLRHRLV